MAANQFLLLWCVCDAAPVTRIHSGVTFVSWQLSQEGRREEPQIVATDANVSTSISAEVESWELSLQTGTRGWGWPSAAISFPLWHLRLGTSVTSPVLWSFKYDLTIYWPFLFVLPWKKWKLNDIIWTSGQISYFLCTRVILNDKCEGCCLAFLGDYSCSVDSEG